MEWQGLVSMSTARIIIRENGWFSLMGQPSGMTWMFSVCAELASALTVCSGLNCHPDSTVELTLMVRVWASQPKGHEYGRAVLTTYLLWHGTGTEVIFFHPTPHLLAVEKAAQGPELQRAIPAPHQLHYSGERVLDSRSLVVGAQVSQP